MQITIGVDVGGTFTDFFFYDFSSGKRQTQKSCLRTLYGPSEVLSKGFAADSLASTPGGPTSIR